MSNQEQKLKDIARKISEDIDVNHQVTVTEVHGELTTIWEFYSGYPEDVCGIIWNAYEELGIPADEFWICASSSESDPFIEVTDRGYRRD